MKQVFVHASWFALATVVYFGGRYTVTPPDASPATVAPTKVREPSPKLASGNVSSGAQLLDSATVVPEWFGDELLSGNKMRGIVVEISMCEDSLLRQTILFSRLLTKLTENNAEATWEALRDNSNGDLASRQRVSLFGYAWGLLQGEQAVKAAMEAQGRDAEVLAVKALEGWARANPEDAMAFMQGEGSPSSSACRMGFLRGLARSQPATAARYLVDLELWTDARPYLKPVIDAQLKAGFGMAEEWTKNLPSEKLKEAGCRMLAESLMKSDPHEAVTWVEGFTSEPYAKDSVVMVVGHFMGRSENHEKNVTFMLDWLGRLPEGTVRDAAYEESIRVWANWDPVSAARFLGDFPDSTTKDLAIRSFSLEASPKDPESAALWAATISDSQLRQRTLVPVARQWLLRDRAATLEWLATLDLPQETMNSIQGIRD